MDTKLMALRETPLALPPPPVVMRLTVHQLPIKQMCHKPERQRASFWPGRKVCIERVKIHSPDFIPPRSKYTPTSAISSNLIL